MRKALHLISPALLLIAMPASAQDFSGMASDSLSSAGSYAGTVGVNSHLKRGSRSANRSHSTSSRVAATCANKGRASANLGPDHPKVRKLYALCAQAGY